MRPHARHEAILTGVLLVACADAGQSAASRHSVDGGAPDESGLDLSRIAGKLLEALSGPEAQRVCEEDAKRTDYCMQAGVTLDTPSSCEGSVAECRRTLDGGGRDVAIGCRGVQFGPAGACAVTVEEYFACVDAWNPKVQCDSVGLLIETPAACQKVMSHCPRVGAAFFRSGRTLPCDPDAGATTPPRASDDIYGSDGCRPLPTRLVVLGDSIAACFTVPLEQCAPYLIADDIRSRWAPDLVVESQAVSGAVTADLPGQARMVAGGPGHVAVWIWAIGNDLLLRHVDYAQWAAAWNDVFSYFTDKARFPDGATFLLNTQYSPFDECPAVQDPTDEWLKEIEPLVKQVNQTLFLDFAERRPDTIAIDQYPDWLGHGVNANVRGCPHCGSDNTSWMLPGFHPNTLGETHIAAKWRLAADQMYGATCHGG